MKRLFLIMLTMVSAISVQVYGACNNPAQGKTFITQPSGSASKDNNMNSSWKSRQGMLYWDFQAIKSGAQGAYILQIAGDTANGGTYSWTLNSSAGTLKNDNKATPTHVAPNVAGEGWLKLQGAAGDGCDQKKVKIYNDCLARDKDNFGVSQSCNPGTWTTPYGNIMIANRWNCHGSSAHLYDGRGNGTATDIEFARSWNIVKTVNISHKSDGGTHPSLGILKRGDLVVYYTAGGQLMHSQTCTGNGNETYGANNTPLSYPGTPGECESWRWGISVAGDWANNLWVPAMPPPLNVNPTISPVTIKVLRKL